MGDITKNISRHELACSCGCGFDSMDWETIKVVQDACDFFALVQGEHRVLLTINSAARCPRHNRAIGSTDTSQHIKARAMDIVIAGVTPEDLGTYLDHNYPDTYGIGVYDNFVHIDTRETKARW